MRQIWTVALVLVAAVCAASPARGQDQCLAPPPQGQGKIEGTVTSAESSQPVLSSVIALGEGPGFASLFGSGFAGVDGTWTMDVPAPATYVVAALPIDTVHAPEFYDGKLTKAAAAKISVADGETVANIDFTVIVGATMSGTVTAEDGGDPVESVRVQAALVGELPHNPSTQTNASGEYTLGGLAVADYQVTFDPDDSPDNYLSEVYDDKPDYPGDSVPVAQDGVTDIDAALGQGGRIEGRVTGPTNQPIAFIPVNALDTYGFGSTATDINGDYSIVVPTGTFHVLVTAAPGLSSEFYDGKFSEASADDVAVTAPDTTSGIDIKLDTSGKITGTITDAISGDPIPFAIATAIDEDGAAGASGAVAFADAQGDYELNSNLHTGQYKVAFFASGYLGAFYSSKTSIESADPVSVTAPGTTPNIDQALTPCDQATTTTIGATTTSLPATTTTSLPAPTTTSLPGTTTTLPGTTTTTLGGGGTCGDPVAFVAGASSAGQSRAASDDLTRLITASDALFVLRAAVATVTCELCVCDVNGSGTITASDALTVLRRAVGLSVELNCPAC